MVDCKRQDHRAELLAPLQIPAPPSLQRDTAYQADLSTALFVEPSGALLDVTTVVLPVGSGRTESVHFDTQRSVSDAIAASLKGLKLRPAVTECKPAQDTIYLRFTVANGTITVSKALYVRP